MKRIIAAAFLLGLVGVAKADPICTDWGSLNVCIPFTTAEGSFGYARLTDPGTGKQAGENQLLIDTKVASIKEVALVFGGSKGQYFSAAPFLGIDYEIPNPIVAPPGAGVFSQFLASLRPGAYAGNSNLHRDGWFYGLKTSKQLW